MAQSKQKENLQKLLLVAPFPPPYGGIANWSVLIKNRIGRDESLELCGVVNISPGKRGMEGRTLWDRVVKSGLEMFRHRREMTQICREARPDVIHITTSGSLALIRDILLLGKARRLGVPTVYHIRFGRVPQMMEANTVEWRLMKRAAALASATIAIDDATYQALLPQVGGKRLYCLPNPFDLSALPQVAEERRKELLFLGWCVKTKGVGELLAAWDQVRRTHAGWKLRLVGPYSEEYIATLRETCSFEDVILEGEREHADALTLLAGASVFVLPSYTEGFPNAVLEAMALQKPVIATTVGAIPQMLEGGCGLLVPPEDVGALAEAMGQLMDGEDEAAGMGRRGAEKLRREYALDVVYDKMKEIWKAVEGSKPI